MKQNKFGGLGVGEVRPASAISGEVVRSRSPSVKSMIKMKPKRKKTSRFGGYGGKKAPMLGEISSTAVRDFITRYGVKAYVDSVARMK